MYRSPDPTPEQLALREQIRAEYPYLIEKGTTEKKISSMALAAKNIKRLLAQEFPGVKFGASSESYSGGSTIHVRWEDFGEGPTVRQVDALVEAKFAYARFDGMTDNTDYDCDPWRTEFRALFGSAAYVATQSYEVSPEENAERQAAKLVKNTPSAAASPRRRGL